MQLTTDQINQINELTNKHNIKADLTYYLETFDGTTIDELTDYLHDQGAFNIEIIYYHNAIAYLKENDPSLQYSLQIAQDMGYIFEDLDSEVLASILASENEREAYALIQDELADILFNTDEDNQ
jgi:hypothetical protein